MLKNTLSQTMSLSKSITENSQFSDTVLSWYDCNARDLPWRANQYPDCSQEIIDPYLIWVS